MAGITARDIHELIQRELSASDEAKLPRLLEFLSNQPNSRTPVPVSETPTGTPAPTPAMPNVVGSQQLVQSNSIAQKYPFLGGVSK